MGVLKYIPISLFILGNTFFDINAPKLNITFLDATHIDTNWSIFYFTVIYSAWLAHCINESMKSKLDLLFFGGLGTGFIIRIYLELSKIGMGYENYIKSINSFESNLLLTLYLIVVLIIILVQLWKHLKNL